MSLALLAIAVSAPPIQLRIMFCGNSHTASYNLPQMVESMLESDGTRRQVTVGQLSGAFLQDIGGRADARDQVRNGNWDYVVLQGAGLSSSHKYKHPQEGAVTLAKLAKAGGAKPLFFAEWPRRGWNETGYILGIYNEIRSKGGGEIVPICKAWDHFRAKHPKVAMWAEDGNHSALPGSYLAASTIYYWIAGPKGKATWRPSQLSPELAGRLRDSARATVEGSR